jgi:hypothetical protein
MVNFFTALSGWVLGSSRFLAGKWRGLTLASIVVLVVCYLLVLLGQQQVVKCPSLNYFFHIYTKVGLLELVPPILLLIFVREGHPDPRAYFSQQDQLDS